MRPVADPARLPDRNRWLGRLHGRSRLLWSLADQATSSLTNFVVAIAVAQVATPRQFGAFSLAFSVFVVVASLARALVCEPLVVRLSDRDERTRREGISAAAGTTVLLGVAVGALGVAVSTQLDRSLADVTAVIAFTLPGLLLQDAWRYSFFAAGKPQHALVNDFLWLVLQMAAFLLPAFGSFTMRVAGWAGAASICSLVGMLQLRIFPQFSLWRSWFSKSRDLGVRFAMEFLLDYGAIQVAFFILGAVSGLGAVGAFAAARIVFGPLTVVMYGVFAFAVPAGIQLARRDRSHFAARIGHLALILGLVNLSWGLVAYSVPDELGRLFLATNWAQAKSLLLPFGVLYGFFGVQQAFRVGLRSLGDARSSLRSRLLTTPALVVFPMIGALLDAARGTVFGLAAGTLVGAVTYRVAFHRSAAVFVDHESGGPQPSP